MASPVLEVNSEQQNTEVEAATPVSVVNSELEAELLSLGKPRIPQYVCFKGDNGRYLRLSTDEFLEFTGENMKAEFTGHETIETPNGFRFRCLANNKLWMLTERTGWLINGTNWIRGSGEARDASSNLTEFEAVMLNPASNAIALRSARTRMYCKRFDRGSGFLRNGYRADTNSIMETFVRLNMEEWVVTREFSNIRYDLSKAKIEEEIPDRLDEKSQSNRTDQTNTHTFELSKEVSDTTLYMTENGFQVGVEASLSFGIPKVGGGSITISASRHQTITWGQENTETTTITTTDTMPVPPWTTVTVRLLSTRGKCSVPFSFEYKQLLPNGVVTPVSSHNGTFHGVNYSGRHVEVTSQIIPH